MPAGGQSRNRHFEPLDGTVDVAHGAAGGAFFAHDVPGFERAAQFQLHAVVLHRAVERKAELPMRPEPGRIEREAVRLQIAQHVEEIVPDEVRQHEPVVQRRAPAHEPVRRTARPRSARCSARISSCCAKLISACGGISNDAELDQPEPAGRAVGRVELVDADFGAMRAAGDVDEQIAEDPVDQPRRDRGRSSAAAPRRRRFRVRRASRAALRRCAGLDSSDR